MLLEAYIAAVGDAGDALPHGPQLRDESLGPGWVNFHFLGFLAHFLSVSVSWIHKSMNSMCESGFLSSGLMWWYSSSGYHRPCRQYRQELRTRLNCHEPTHFNVLTIP